MIATISPATNHQEETLNTLKYARRAKAIRNSTQQMNVPKPQRQDFNTDIAVVARLKAKLHQLQCQLYEQTSHPSAEGRFLLLVKAENPGSQIPEQQGTTTTLESEPQAAAEAVNLLFEDIDALTTENALLTEQVAALQASLKESGDRFAFLQSLAQQRQTYATGAEQVSGTAAVATAAATTSNVSGDKRSRRGLVEAPVVSSNTNSTSGGGPPHEDNEMQLLLLMRPQPQLQSLHQQDEDFEVPTEEQELQGIDCHDDLQQQAQPLALQPQGLIPSRDKIQFDDYFSPQSADATDSSPAKAKPSAVALLASAATPESSGVSRALGLGPFRFFSKSSALSRLCNSTPSPQYRLAKKVYKFPPRINGIVLFAWHMRYRDILPATFGNLVLYNLLEIGLSEETTSELQQLTLPQTLLRLQPLLLFQDSCKEREAAAAVFIFSPTSRVASSVHNRGGNSAIITKVAMQHKSCKGLGPRHTGLQPTMEEYKCMEDVNVDAQWAGCSSKSSFGGERRCSSSAAARAAADTWRGTHNQKQHHKQRQEQLQKINNKEQQLLSPSAANWQQLWHHSNSHAPKFSEARCNSSRDCNNSGRSTNVVHVVLLNLGSPAEPTYTALWMYLRQFLGDARVVESPRFYWLPLLYFLILPIRSRKFAARETVIRAGTPVAAPHTAIAAVYAYVPAGTSAARVMPDLRMVAGYSKHERYIDAIAALVKKFWEQNGRGDHLLFSYHSIPLDMSRSAGDPYACLCFQTSRLVAEKLDLQPEEYEVAMQSRTGCSAWAEPYLIPALEALAKAGCLQVDVVLPGFAADCLETLEEIQQEAAAHFKAVTDGRGELRVVPCLNDSDEAVNLIESLVLENTQQWWRQPA
ncbi:kinesin motor domain-containing protein [Cyclospora cayetanensis]|uniref:Ferrochelatase n=1 Tax=Cyclospora cayetanensis TaxID=88456 RepID=A0A1D3CU44_9EIME|nr:kinesin motor domain-containing protein [Cyclospora cayetanensis]